MGTLKHSLYIPTINGMLSAYPPGSSKLWTIIRCHAHECLFRNVPDKYGYSFGETSQTANNTAMILTLSRLMWSRVTLNQRGATVRGSKERCTGDWTWRGRAHNLLHWNDIADWHKHWVGMQEPNAVCILVWVSLLLWINSHPQS